MQQKPEKETARKTNAATRRLQIMQQNRKFNEEYSYRCPMGRMAETDEISGLALYNNALYFTSQRGSYNYNK